MLTLFLLLKIIVLCKCEEKFDPKKVDYCKLNCEDSQKGLINSACHCSKTPYRVEILDNITEFRKICLEKHNEYRELVASGKETRIGLTSAADMQALSYSLELEYFVRCFARNSFSGEHDKCRRMSNNAKMGQNFGVHPDERGIAGDIRHIWKWYEELVDLPATAVTIEKFAKAEDKKIGHFTQVIWSTMSLIGCVRFYTPDPKKINFPEHKLKAHYALICNYAALKPSFGLRPNLIGNPVYKRGKPCTACRFGKCENPKYPSLCGKIEPLPMDPPYDFGDNGAKDSPNNIRDSGATRTFSTYSNKLQTVIPFFAIIFVF